MTDDPRIDPADLRSVRFPGSFRRYEARAVDEFLESVAQRVEATNALVDDLRRQLDEAGVPPATTSSAFTLLPREETVFDAEAPEPKIEPEPEPVVEPAPSVEKPDLGTLSDDELVQLVGEETAHVLATARRAADDIRSKAEESAARVIREATAEAKRLVDEAEARSAELTSEAQTVRDAAVAVAQEEADRVRAEAEATAEQIRSQAEADERAAAAAAERIRAEAEEEAARALEDARTEGRNMVGEAKEVRARILADLQRRRDTGRSQVERLAAGRQRLLDAYATVRANVDEITEQLDSALVEPAPPEDDDLEDEIEAAVAHVAAADADRAANESREDADEPDESDEAPDTVDRSEDDEPTEESADESAPDVDDVDETVEVAEPAPTDESDEPEVVESEVVEPEPEPEVEAVEPEPEPVEGSIDETTEDHGETDDVDDPAEESGNDVDALFARIRSERAESVARAQQVLSAGESAADETAEPEPEVEPEVETAPEPAADETAAPDAASQDRVPAELLADAEAIEIRASAVAKLEKSLSRALKRHLADEQNEVLDALRQSESTDAADLLPARDAQVDGYADVAIDDLAAAAEAGAATVDGGGDSADAGALAVTLAESLIDPFRRRIEDSAADVDGDADALDERLRALYREWKVERIGPAVADALLDAYAAGQYASAPDGSSLRWLIDPDQGPCPDAQDNALAGAVAKGDAFPTGDSCPQAHPGCRCLLTVEG